jgi:adenosylcobyric acid synthase
MVQGTASHVGKTTLVAALCRLFAREGWRVAPFKAQNISLNAAVTPDGREIGVAQAVQARAAGVPAEAAMNPVLVKPSPGGRTQVVVLGRAARLSPPRAALWPVVARSLDALRARYDLVVAEGAGAAAEVNLRRTDLTNMRVARHAGAAVLLAGDIDRGGVFAALAGTVALLDRRDRALVGGLIINKFRGDAASLRPAVRDLERRTRRPVLGVIPYAPAWRLPEEDAVVLDAPAAIAGGANESAQWLEIAVVQLPYISNFDEFDALEQDGGVRLRYIRPGAALGSPDLVILPGSKSTMADLDVLRRSGLAEAVRGAAAAGTPVFGICGGYQMLGRRVEDPHRVESDRSAAEGLGLLPVVTTFGRPKRTTRVRVRLYAWPAHTAAQAEAPCRIDTEGYEIHMGRTESAGTPRRRGPGAWLRIVERNGRPCDEPGGAASLDGGVFGTAVHGILRDAAARQRLLDALWARRGTRAAGGSPKPPAHVPGLDERLDGLADLVARHLDFDRVRALAGLPRC